MVQFPLGNWALDAVLARVLRKPLAHGSRFLPSPVRVTVLPVIFTRPPTVSGSALILILSVSFYNAVSAVMYLILKCPSATSPTPLFGC